MSGVSITQPRISPPALVSASTSSTSSVARRFWMRSARPLCAMNNWNACAVVAKPPGTDTPSLARLPIISPSDAFFPPTLPRSVMRRSSSQRTRSLKGITPEGKRGRAGPASEQFSGFAPVRASCRGAHTHVSPVDSRGQKPPGSRMRRTIFYISDGTGITAETIGHSVLTQFETVEFETFRIPFVDTEDKARAAAVRIKTAFAQSGARPIVVNTIMDQKLSDTVAESGALMLDVFAPFLGPLAAELGTMRSAR